MFAVCQRQLEDPLGMVKWRRSARQRHGLEECHPCRIVPNRLAKMGEGNTVR